MRTRVALVLLAACGSTPASHAGDPPASHVEARHPTTPAPHIALKPDHVFDNRGLPAIARASEVVVLLASEATGPTMNLHLEVRGRDDKLLQTIPIVTPQQGDAVMAGTEIPADVQKNIDEANRQLDMLHGVHDLQVMMPLAVEPGHDDEDQHWATGDNLDVEWRQHHLSVFRHNNKNALADRDGVSWLAPDQVVGGTTCSNPAYLSGVYHAPDENVVLVEISYRGTDSCWEPAPQLHVVTWYER